MDIVKTIRKLLVLLVVVTMSNNAWAQSENIGQRGNENCTYEWWGVSRPELNPNGGNYAYYVKEEPYDDADNPKITDVIGWHNTNDDVTSANSHMAIVGGNVYLRNVYGGYSTSGAANNNVVIINSGTFSGNVAGGYANSIATANNNKVTINGGNYIDDANEKAISGGQGMYVTGNEVIIYGGTIACEVNGGIGMNVDATVSGNTVTIYGGTINRIFGANVGDTHYGGIKAYNNTVNILKSISVKQLSGGIGDTSWGNTLNLGATGIAVGDDGVTHFQIIAVTEGLKLTEGATVLSAKKFLNADGTNFSGTLDLSRAEGLSSGDPGTMTLLASETADNFSNLKLVYNTATKETPVTITTEGVPCFSRVFVEGNEDMFYSYKNKVALTNDKKNVTFTAIMPHISYTDMTNVEAGEVTLYVQPAVSDTDAGYKVDTDADNNVMLSLVDGFKKLTIERSTWGTMNNNGGTLGMNMPKTGINTLMLNGDAGCTFKVYDDGGSGNYSNGCNGTLVITAPAGYLINVKSNSIALKQTSGDYLEIFDNNTASGTLLGSVKGDSYDGSPIDYISTGNHMTLHFESSTDDNNAAGLDLTVTIGPGLVTGGDKYIAYCSDEGNWKMSDANVQVYVVTGYNLQTGTVYVQEISGNEIPKGVPVIIGNKTDGNALPASFMLQGEEELSDEAAGSISGGTLANFFVCDGTKNVDALLTAALGPTADLSDYVLFTLVNGSFKPISATAESTPAKGTCVLAVSKVDILTKGSISVGGTSNARTLTIDLGGETTGIEEMAQGDMQNAPSDGSWYDLQGRKFSGQPTRKGVYIRNGRAVVIH